MLPNPDGRLRPGLFARVELVLNERNDAIQVPEQALVPQGQDQFVFKVVDGKAALTKVELGIRRDGMVEIARARPPTIGGHRGPDQDARRRRGQAGCPTAGGLSPMVLSELSIRRPVLATVMSLVVVLLGLVAYGRLHGARVPEHRRAGGYGRDHLHGRVGRHHREPGHPGRSRSRSPASRASTYMSSISRPETQPDHHPLPARRAIPTPPPTTCATASAACARQLPDEIDEPVIAKVEADAQPIIYIAFSSDRHSPLEVTDYADRFVKDRLQNLPGVADVRIFGERRYAMRIWLDAARLAAYSLTPQDVENALRRQNVEIPAGRIESVSARVHRASARPTCATPEQFERHHPASDGSGYPVRLGDVAQRRARPLETSA